MQKGQLILIPTPLFPELPLEPVALQELQKASDPSAINHSLIVFEEIKEARRRWLSWGLPRASIEHFFLYNEHNKEKGAQTLLQELKSGKNVYLMSDGGLPAFCDPGQILVDLCHESGLPVTATPFPHSISLAIALSGFPAERFVFWGFVPRESQERESFLRTAVADKRLGVLMDTPYRLKRLLEELQQLEALKKRRIFLAADLNGPLQQLYRGEVAGIWKVLHEFKREFILLLAPM